MLERPCILFFYGKGGYFLRKFFYYVFPLLIWAAVIFLASSQSYQQQDIRPFLRGLDLEWVDRYFNWVSFTYANAKISIDYRGTAGFVEFFIRKAAHVAVFFVLGFLTFRMLLFMNMHVFRRVLISIFLVFIYAVIDEFRHLLHPNRSGLLEDVLLDTIGGLLGIILAIIVYRKNKKGKTRH